MNYQQASELLHAVQLTNVLTAQEMKHRSIYELLASAIEELGEFSIALQIEEKSIGKLYKPQPPEPAMTEAVDVTICGLALFFARGGTIEQLIETAHRKLEKWRKNAESTERMS